jgi:hypothetical protein
MDGFEARSEACRPAHHSSKNTIRVSTSAIDHHASLIFFGFHPSGSPGDQELTLKSL